MKDSDADDIVTVTPRNRLRISQVSQTEPYGHNAKCQCCIIDRMSTPQDATSVRLLALPALPVPPTTVRRATVFICVGAALAVAAGVFDAIAIGDPAAANLSVSHTGSPTFGVIDGLVLAALWVWMAWKTGTGRNWARVVSTVFFGLLSVYCGKFVFELFSVTAMKAVTAGYLGAFFLQWIVGLVALILLWRYPSSEFFAIRARSKTLASS